MKTQVVLLGEVSADSLLAYLMGETSDPCDPLYDSFPTDYGPPDSEEKQEA